MPGLVRTASTLYGWVDNGEVCLSLFPRDHARKAFNRYAHPLDALAEASRRQKGIQWEDPDIIERMI